jgi:hypothetical protein
VVLKRGSSLEGLDERRVDVGLERGSSLVVSRERVFTSGIEREGLH